MKNPNYNQIQKSLVRLCEQAHEAGIRHSGLSGTLCENILIEELRKIFPKLNFNRGVIKFGPENFSTQMDIVVYRGRPEFQVGGSAVISAKQVLATIEVKKWIYPKMLEELRGWVARTEAGFHKNSRRKIPIFLVTFRSHDRRNGLNWFKATKNFPTPYRYCFFGGFSHVNKRNLYPWEEAIWNKFQDSPYSGQFEKLINDIKKLKGR